MTSRPTARYIAPWRAVSSFTRRPVYFLSDVVYKSIQGCVRLTSRPAARYIAPKLKRTVVFNGDTDVSATLAAGGSVIFVVTRYVIAHRH